MRKREAKFKNVLIKDHNYVLTYFANMLIFSGMWASREMTSKEDREIFVRTTIRELIVYLIFLVVFCFCKYTTLNYELIMNICSTKQRRY